MCRGIYFLINNREKFDWEIIPTILFYIYVVLSTSSGKIKDYASSAADIYVQVDLDS